MKKFDINTKVKMIKKRITWNERLAAKGIKSWEQSVAELKEVMSAE